MRKRISLKTRHSDLTIAEFRDHYENRHVPLGLSYIERFQWRRYVRNYVVECFGSPVAFDGYTEFWDDGDNDDVLAAFLSSPEFEVLDRDDRCFLSVDRRFSAVVEEEVLVGVGDRDCDARKYALLWRGAGMPARDSAEFAGRLVTRLGDRLVEATLDRVAGPPSLDAPFEYMLSLRVAGEKPPLGEGEAWPSARASLIRLDPVETPSDLLYRD